MRRKTNEQFLKEMAQNHPTITPLEEYTNNRTKIKVQCNVCGYIYMVAPTSLYMGIGCGRCAGRKRTHENFVSDMAKINNDIEIIEKYQGSKTKIKVKCKVCGLEWESSPNSLLRSKGCPDCAGTRKRTNDEFIEIMKELHPTITVIGEYKNNCAKVECLCNKCGHTFYGIPKTMIYHNCGCKHCSTHSTGEYKISNWLFLNNINYEQQKLFDGCKDVRRLPFDFYLNDFNLVIEYDGDQHYKPNEYFGGDDGLNYTKRHDEIKNKFCEENGIELLRIPYWEYENIESILKEKLAV